jgi:hypothetical protein
MRLSDYTSDINDINDMILDIQSQIDGMVNHANNIIKTMRSSQKICKLYEIKTSIEYCCF